MDFLQVIGYLILFLIGAVVVGVIGVILFWFSMPIWAVLIAVFSS